MEVVFGHGEASYDTASSRAICARRRSLSVGPPHPVMTAIRVRQATVHERGYAACISTCASTSQALQALVMNRLRSLLRGLKLPCGLLALAFSELWM